MYLGIDGGGTKTASVIVDEAGRELGRGIGGPCNIATGDDELLARSVREAVESALGSAGLPLETRFVAVCAGVAGYTAKRRRADFARILAESVAADSRRVEPDYVIAYWGATEGQPAVVVIAGTGAVVYGRNAGGETSREDGRGYLLGDKGSAFSIGLDALQQTLSRLDQGSELNPLGHAVLEAIAGESGDDIVEWVYRDFSPARIARLVEPIARLSAEGDATAQLLFKWAGRELAQSARTVLRRLELGHEPRVYQLGGLWQASNLIDRAFRVDLRYRPLYLSASHDPAFGAALLAASSRD